MRDIRLFKRELELIKDAELRDVVRSYMENGTPNYFWTIGLLPLASIIPSFRRVLADWFAIQKPL